MISMTRRNAIFALGFSLLFGVRARAAQSKVTLGAIRWDIWYEPNGSQDRALMEHVLDSKQWRSRAPSCAVITSGKMDFGPCATQSRMDEEIRAANKGNIDYWAFFWYNTDHPLQAAWRLYRSSSINNLVNWCMIIGTGTFISEDIPRLTGFMNGKNYQEVLSSRPLLYLLHENGTENGSIREKVNSLRSSCQSAGVPNPYVVYLYGADGGLVHETGVDAIGIYSKPSAAPPRAPYADLKASTEAYWNHMADMKQQMVPTALTGADRRPRIETPVPWEAKRQKPGVGIGNYYEAGTPSEIASHVVDMVKWIETHKAACPAQTGLIYSWDEHDEGGSTLSPSKGDGEAIIDAVGTALKANR